MAIFAVKVVNSALIVATFKLPNVDAYATPYVIGNKLRAVKGLGTTPLISKPKITDTTGSEALITCVNDPPPFWNIAITAQAWPAAFSTAMGNNLNKSDTPSLGAFRIPKIHKGMA